MPDSARATTRRLGQSPATRLEFICSFPYVPLFPSLPWLVFSGLVFLAYQVLAGYSSSGVWQQAAWVKWAEYVPFYALLGMSLLRAVVSRVGLFIAARRSRA